MCFSCVTVLIVFYTCGCPCGEIKIFIKIFHKRDITCCRTPSPPLSHFITPHLTPPSSSGVTFFELNGPVRETWWLKEWVRGVELLIMEFISPLVWPLETIETPKNYLAYDWLTEKCMWWRKGRMMWPEKWREIVQCSRYLMLSLIVKSRSGDKIYHPGRPAKTV